jgi:hypothetical protein
LLVSFLLLGLFAQELPAFSQTHYTMTSYLRCTRDDAILQALTLMSNGEAEPSLHRIVSRPARVIFKDMKSIDKSLKNYDALSWISSSGQQVIFVNEKHRNAPPEALAAMIAHEAMHDDILNSVSEEVSGWTQEARVWMEMKSRNPALAHIPSGAYPLVDRLNKIEQEYQQGTLSVFVRSRPGYKNLPETSPGFGSDAAVAR